MSTPKPKSKSKSKSKSDSTSLTASPPASPFQPPAPPSLVSIFWNFFVIGGTAYGGPAMMPAFRKRLVETVHWVSREEFRLGLGLCQTIPGGTLMQLAAYVGLGLRGLKGALAAYSGFSAPAFLLVTLLSAFYVKSQSLPLAVAVFAGLKVVVLGICLMSCLDFVRRFAPTKRHQVFTVAAAALFLAGAGAVTIVAGAALGGILLLEPGPAPESDRGQGSNQALRLALWLGGAELLGLGALYLTDRTLFDLAVSMIKVDMLAFGGFGVFPVMFAEVVQHRGWMDEHTFIDGMALAQVTPGPTMLASAFVGFCVRGVWGAVVASMSIFAASLVVVLAAARFRGAILGSVRARKALAGVLATLGGMIIAVCVSLGQVIPWGWQAAVLLLATLAALYKNVPTPWIVLCGAGVSMLVF